ncbi:MAG: hypothetical protein M3406_07200 [Chloroflexota bacterium]|nr:hypothetical protein [Chloroflexota bacterium]
MRARPILLAILGLVAGCGPWIITPETPTPSASPSAPTFADERALLAAQFDRVAAVTRSLARPAHFRSATTSSARTRGRSRRQCGLEALGGQVINRLWVMPILDDEISADQRWEIRDSLGIGLMQSGTAALFLSDEPRDGQSTLCQSTH